MPDREALTMAARRLCDAAEAVAWRGPDAYDGLWWRWPAPLVGGKRRRQAIAQIHARSPLDVRRLYRRRHPFIPKAAAVFALARARLGQDEGARNALGFLDAERSSGGPAWGYLWDVQTRWGFYAAGEPNVVVTAYACRALWQGAESLDSPNYSQRASAAAAWVQDALFADDHGFYAYHPGSPAVIHNASLLGAWVVYRLGGAEDSVRRAVERALDAQRPDGSWPYGEGSGLEFTDSFHTGFVLECLDELASLDPRVGEAVRRGAEHYVSRFFGPAGQARLWPDREYPEDAHSAGTALSVLSRLDKRGLVPDGLIDGVVARVLSHMLRRDHAINRRYRWGATRVNYLRWADAHVALGLADAAGR